MGLFSRTTESKDPVNQSVPQDIFNAVNVMKGDSSLREQSIAKSSLPSPFLFGEKKQERPVVPPQEILKNESKQVAEQAAEVPQKSMAGISIGKNKKKILIFAVGSILVIGAGISAWYFLRPSLELPVAPETSETTPVLVVPEAKVVTLPFVPDAPNYLSVDTEAVTDLSLWAMLSQAGVKIIEANMGQPVEFLLTDKNNNPIAFSRFVYLMNIPFGEDLVASFDEPFSIFLYNDAGKIRLGLSLAFTDPVKSQKLVMTKEKTLPYLLRTVLFRESTVSRESIFRSGVYKDQAVRFVNIDTAQNISFDYAFRDKHWFIGTSKDTLRAILDKE